MKQFFSVFHICCFITFHFVKQNNYFRIILFHRNFTQRSNSNIRKKPHTSRYTAFFNSYNLRGEPMCSHRTISFFSISHERKKRQRNDIPLPKFLRLAVQKLSSIRDYPFQAHSKKGLSHIRQALLSRLLLESKCSTSYNYHQHTYREITIIVFCNQTFFLFAHVNPSLDDILHLN